MFLRFNKVFDTVDHAKLYRVSHGKRMFLKKTKLCECFNKNLLMYNKNIH